MEHIEFNEWQLVIVKNYVNMVCVCVSCCRLGFSCQVVRYTLLLVLNS